MALRPSLVLSKPKLDALADVRKRNLWGNALADVAAAALARALHQRGWYLRRT